MHKGQGLALDMLPSLLLQNFLTPSSFPYWAWSTGAGRYITSVTAVGSAVDTCGTDSGIAYVQQPNWSTLAVAHVPQAWVLQSPGSQSPVCASIARLPPSLAHPLQLGLFKHRLWPRPVRLGKQRGLLPAVAVTFVLARGHRHSDLNCLVNCVARR